MVRRQFVVASCGGCSVDRGRDDGRRRCAGGGAGRHDRAITGVVTDSQQQPVAGASVIAIHEPSGTTYEATTRADGRFSIPGMRVGGPYTVTVAFTGAGTRGLRAADAVGRRRSTSASATDLPITVRAIAVQETVTVTAQSDTVFSSARTGAATSVSRAEIATLPTISGRISDLTRLTPQASRQLVRRPGQPPEQHHGRRLLLQQLVRLGGQPGERTGVAPISLESIEQVQVSVAPFDVRQGNFVGAGVNTVTRSGTNRLTGSFYHRFRNEDFVGTEAEGPDGQPGTFKFRNTGGWAGGPIVKNRLFAFGNYENEKDDAAAARRSAPTTGGEPVGGNVTRVLASDLEHAERVSASRTSTTRPAATTDLDDADAGQALSCSGPTTT